MVSQTRPRFFFDAKFIFDFFIPPLFIAYLAFEPHFNKGFENYLESGWHASAIQAIFSGKVIYKDFYFMYGPLSVYGPAFLMQVFGKTLWVLRAYFLSADILTMLLIYALSRLLIRQRVFASLAAVLAVIETHYPSWASRWGGFRFTFAYAAIAMLVLFSRSKNKKYVAAAGIFSALACLHGFDMGILCLLTGGLFLSLDFTLLLFFMMIFLAALVPFFIFLIKTGAMTGFASHLASLTATQVWAQPFDLGDRDGIKFFYPLVAYLFAFEFLVFSKPKEKEAENLGPVFLVSFFGLCLYFYSFRAVQGPQFEAALAPCVLVSFYFFEKLYVALKQKRSWVRRAGLTTIFIAGMGYNFFSPKRFYNGDLLAVCRYQIHKQEIMKDAARGFVPWRSLKMRPANVERARGLWFYPEQAQEIEQVVASVRAHTKKGEAVFTFPDLGVFNFLTDRSAVGRFTMSGAAWPKKEWREELLRELQKEKPRLVLLNAEISDLALTTGRNEEVLPEIREYILRNYKRDQKIGSIDVYSLR